MAKWQYKCDTCGYSQTSETKIKYFVGYDCPECKDGTILDFSEPNTNIPMVIVQQEARTLAQQADRNSKRMGYAECQERELKKKDRLEAVRRARGHKRRKKAETPWWRDGSMPGLVPTDKPLTPEQCEKYKAELETVGCRVHPNAMPPKEIKNAKKQRKRTP